MALGLIHRPRAVALVALAAAALALAGCTSPTPYEPAGDSNFGYSELRLEDNRYRVTFAGNTATPRSTVDNYVLYRAPELTVANGYNYFQLVSKDTDKAVDRPLIVPTVGVFGGSRWGRLGVGIGTSLGLGSGPEKRFTMIANVLMYRGVKPSGNASAYDAQSVLQNLPKPNSKAKS